jgi:hypothetical protein
MPVRVLGGYTLIGTGVDVRGMGIVGGLTVVVIQGVLEGITATGFGDAVVGGTIVALCGGAGV